MADFEEAVYYPEDYDFNTYHQDFQNNHVKSKFRAHLEEPRKAKRPIILPTLNYLNERKCPIYVHHIKNDSSVFNNYNSKFVSNPDRRNFNQKVQNNSKFVLDKLEESYWATWKPKKNTVYPDSSKKVEKVELKEVKPNYVAENKGLKKATDKPHGDNNENIIKHFKAKDFDSSTAASVDQINHSNQKRSQKKLSKGGKKHAKTTKKAGVSQEIQTEVHCPVVLSQIEDGEEPNIKKDPTDSSEHVLQIISPEAEQESPETNPTFVEHKDSIVITKEKQEKNEHKPHFQQPKCIRLYRRAGATSAYIKGGSYPLKSCLKKDTVKGNFRLGAPGSPLFVTTTSFAGKKRK